ncbi:hypothetical protein KR009_001397, partial [Drosophila setifemur]
QEKPFQNLKMGFKKPEKLQWYYAPIFFAFWLVLYLSLVKTQMHNLPTPLKRSDEVNYPGSFIAQRAEEKLIELTRIGPRVLGSSANEKSAVEFLRAEVAKVESELSDRLEIEMDVQQASGAYTEWSMVSMYQGIQNVVVKLSERNSTNENYLLINSHFDSVPGSPGAGDDGSMVVTMLEVLRVMAKSGDPLAHPIIFLFNGAEENLLQASHAFITQHKWAKNCKALINLDSAGSGGREILFQSGPNHPWLMNYYKNVPHPFANTLAEELFQGGYIPSDTDFRFFRDFGPVPGLDMAYISNGYVYHTKYDRIKVFPRASLQHTGDNILSLARALANAPEVDDTAAHSEGHNIFYDFLGWFMIFYTETTSIVVNVVVAVIALLGIGISVYFMCLRSGCSWKGVLLRFSITFAIQFISLILAVGLAILVAVFMDGVSRSMTWFTSSWTIFGLYLAPIIFGLSILPAVYLEKTKRDPLSLGFRIQLFMHSHCICLILIMLILTGLSIRSAYLIMICVVFDILALIVNLVTKFHRKGEYLAYIYWMVDLISPLAVYLFATVITICQILPFMFFTYLCTVALVTLLPMQGRSGTGANPDITIAGLVGIFSLLFAGFIVSGVYIVYFFPILLYYYLLQAPLILLFRKTRTIVLCFLGITILFIIIAVTNVGFPYQKNTTPQRYSMIHAHRRLHNADGSTRVDDSGLYIYPQDRRTDIAHADIDFIGDAQKASDLCGEEMFCGLPLYTRGWNRNRENSRWIETSEPPEIPTEYPKMVLQESIELENPTQRRFNFSLAGPSHMGIFINVKNDARILTWSFNDTLLRRNAEPPFMVFFTWGLDDSILEFTIDVEMTNSTFEGPSLEIGIGGHWMTQDVTSNKKLNTYIDRFPAYAYIEGWVGTYETWYF